MKRRVPFSLPDGVELQMVSLSRTQRFLAVASRGTYFFKRRRLGTVFPRLFVIVFDFLYDLKHGINTGGWISLRELTIHSDHIDSGVHYEPTRVIPLRNLFRTIYPLLPREPVLLDFGCGKGRPLLVASEFGFKAAHGVEFAQELCEIARRNHKIYKTKTGTATQFGLTHADAVDYPIQADENVFFFSNPFEREVLSMVLDNIVAGLRASPRPILVIFYNSHSNGLIRKRTGFQVMLDCDIWGHHFTVFAN